MVHLQPLDRLRLERGVLHLHNLGPRAEAEFLAELAGKIGGLPAILGLLAEYQAKLSPAKLRASGGDRFPPRALRRVAG
jgi:hypothetical protein